MAGQVLGARLPGLTQGHSFMTSMAFEAQAHDKAQTLIQA